MSHSTVLVIGPADEEALEHVLAPFDEELAVPRYIKATKADQIWKRRERLAYATECYAKYVIKEPPYDNVLHVNPSHIEWITKTAPAENRLDDEALWEVILTEDDDEDRDDEGNLWSTYNPNSKWDWFVVGGRWDGVYPLRNGNQGLAEDLFQDGVEPTFAVLDQKGQWHERGHMGWWALVSDEMDEQAWNTKWWEIVKAADPKTPVWLVDVHI